MIFSIFTAKFSRSFSSFSSYHKLPKSPSLQTLLKSGFTPTVKDFNHFLLFLYRRRKFEAIIYFFSQMNAIQIDGNAQTHSIFARALLKLNKFDEAEQFMKTQMAESMNYPRSRLWDTLIQGVCINRKDPEKALTVLKDCFRNLGILPSSFTFCSLINSFSSQGLMGKAIEVLELMADEKVKYPFDNFVCSSVISGFCKIGKPELAMEFFHNAVNSHTLRPNVVTYTALVSSLCMLGRVEEVSDLICRMEKEALMVDVVFYSSWICGYFNQGGLVEGLLKHGQMVEKGINPDTISYTILIDRFSKEGNVEKAVGFLNKMMKEGLRPSLVTYTAIILGFCKKGKLKEAFAIFNMVESKGIKLDEFAYATLIDGICRKGDFDQVYHLLEEMEEKGIDRSIVTYNTVINGLCKAGRTFEADELSKGIQGDIITYSILLHWYTEEENITGILETKKRLEDAGVGMDVVMCNILLKALFMAGAFEDAYSLYRGMPEMDLIADSVTYYTLIDGYCKVSRLNEALEIFDEFRETSISSVSCYSCIISGLCKKGLLGMATEVFIELSEKGLALDVGVYVMLIKEIFEEKSAEGILNLVRRIENFAPDVHGVMCNAAILLLCERGFPEAACQVCMVMSRKGSVMTKRSYYSTIKGLVGDGKKWLAQPLLNTFVKKYGLIDPRVCEIIVHYLCLKDVNSALWFLEKMREGTSSIMFPFSVLKALIKKDRVLDVYKIITEAEDNLPIMNVVDYSTVIDGLCKGGYLFEALDLCAFSKNKGITLNIISYNTVINGLCLQGCLMEAFRLFESLEKIDLVASEITYCTLIDTLCREGFLLDAKQLFDRMIGKGYAPNTHVYNSFIDVYCRFGHMEEALKLLHDMEIKCLNPDGFTVSAVINGCCQKGDMEGALGIFLEFKKKGILPDFLGFVYMIKGLYSKGRMEEARNILREMLQSQTIVELINRIDTGVETDSLESILFFLCEQGSIKEAVTVLNEVGSILFPVRRESNAYASLEKLNNLYKHETSTAVALRSKTSPCKTDFGSCDVEKGEEVTKLHGSRGKVSQFLDFKSCYSQIASLCSKGELHKANRLVKEMLSKLN